MISEEMHDFAVPPFVMACAFIQQEHELRLEPEPRHWADLDEQCKKLVVLVQSELARAISALPTRKLPACYTPRELAARHFSDICVVELPKGNRYLVVVHHGKIYGRPIIDEDPESIAIRRSHGAFRDTVDCSDGYTP